MTARYQAPRGTRDLWGGEVALFQQIEDAARTVFIHYGYTEMRTPIFEPRDLFERSVGDETDIVAKELYAFTDRKGREMALRPEGTAGAVRAFIERKLAAGGGIQKFYYLGPMFRYERPQGGRYRQFSQLGCELFGASGVAADAEVIDLAWRLLDRLGISARLRLNHLGCAECRKAFSESLVRHFSERRADLCEHCARRLERNPLRLLDCKSDVCRGIASTAPSMRLCEACEQNYASLVVHLEAIGIEAERDPRLVRGLDYYTGMVFEIVSDRLGAQDAVLGGGRYDHLVADLGGAPTPAVGFAIGLDRLAMILGQGEPRTPVVHNPFLYVVGLGAEGRVAASSFTKAMRRVHEASVMLMGMRPVWIEQALVERSLKAHLREADRLGATYVALLGENEIAAGCVVIREMAGGNQVTMPVAGKSDDELRQSLAGAVRQLTEIRQSVKKEE